MSFSHPKLILETYKEKVKNRETIDEDLNKLVSLIPSSSANIIQPEHSGKLWVLYRMLSTMKILTPSERIVIVSNYTSTLDLIELLCKQEKWSFLRLDGSVSSKRRTAIVAEFNNPKSTAFVFLLSSKAGGCGINLIGANRLILLDPSWNPAEDKQAAGRIWREGQLRKCYIYRFLSNDSIEEKIFQRQLSKENLQTIVDDVNIINNIPLNELKKLFRYRGAYEVDSDTHDMLECPRCAIRKKASTVTTLTSSISPSQVEKLSAFMLFYLSSVDQMLSSSDADYYEYLRQPSTAASEKLDCSFGDFVLPSTCQVIVQLYYQLHEDPIPFTNLSNFSKTIHRMMTNLDQNFYLAEHSAMFPPKKLPIYVNFQSLWNSLILELFAATCSEVTTEKKTKSMSLAATSIETAAVEYVEQLGCPDDSELKYWSHHRQVDTCTDEVLKAAMKNDDTVRGILLTICRDILFEIFLCRYHLYSA